MNNQEYLRRNLVVASAYGVRAGIDSALVRLSKTKRRPKWLYDLLGREYAKMDEIIKAVVKHRNTAQKEGV